MPNFERSNVFPNQAVVRSVSKGDLHRLYFATTSERFFKGKQLSEADHNESFTHIHMIGQRSTKYLEVTPNTTPLLDRNSCKYTRDFFPHNLAQKRSNSEFRSLVAESARSVLVPAPSLTTSTFYKEDFSPQVEQEEQRELAYPPTYCSQAPTHTLNLMGAKVAQSSFSQTKHNGTMTNFSRGKTAGQGKSNLTMTGRGGLPADQLLVGDVFRSQYDRTFRDFADEEVQDEGLLVPAEMVPQVEPTLGVPRMVYGR